MVVIRYRERDTARVVKDDYYLANGRRGDRAGNVCPRGQSGTSY